MGFHMHRTPAPAETGNAPSRVESATSAAFESNEAAKAWRSEGFARNTGWRPPPPDVKRPGKDDFREMLRRKGAHFRKLLREAGLAREILPSAPPLGRPAQAFLGAADERLGHDLRQAA